MNEQRFETSDAPQIVIPACQGNLVVQSWRETAVSIQGDGVVVEQSAPAVLQVTAVADLYVAAPKQARLTLGTIGGDLTIKHLSGGVTIDDAAGRVTVRNLDAVTITRAAQTVLADNINGQLVIEEVVGAVDLRSVRAVQIHRALGDVTLQFANGHVSVGQVDGRLDVRTVNGDLIVEKALDDVVLANLGGRVNVAAAQSIWLAGGLASGVHKLAAGADIYVYWPPDAPLNLTARGALVEHDLPLEHETTGPDNEQTVLTGHIEEGKVDLFVEGGQRVAFRAWTGAAPQFSAADFQFAPLSPPENDLATAVRAVLAEIAAELPP
ncbi:MAG: hypothetical protein KC441_03805, partial [Anaerolineales bacterium]|nr:hypothetical protein [Anaerolineales bacterium]